MQDSADVVLSRLDGAIEDLRTARADLAAERTLEVAHAGRSATAYATDAEGWLLDIEGRVRAVRQVLSRR